MSDPKDLNLRVFCPLPFVHINNVTTGEISACCHSSVPIKKSDGTFYNLATGDSFEDAFRSEHMQALRKNMIEGVRDPQCSQCWKHEDLGVTSKRLDDGMRYLEQAKAALAVDPIPFTPVSWDIKLGMNCNLKCRMCNATTSSAILSEAAAQGWIDKSEASQIYRDYGNLLRRPEVKAELMKIIDFAEEVYFLGGEPTLNSEHCEILDVAIQSGAAKRMTVRWSTNLANFNDEFVRRAREFAKVRIDCSIDGIGAVNDYIRYPMRWSEVDSRIRQLQVALPKAKLQVVCTVQIYNVFDLENILAWGDELGVNIGFNFLSYPDHLAVYELPAHIKAMLYEKYAPLANRKLDGVCRWLKAERRHSNLKEFFSYTGRLDRVRKQNLFDIIPEPFRSAMQLEQSNHTTPESSDGRT